MEYHQLEELLFANSNSKYNSFNSKVVNSGVPMIGCTVPFVRSVAKTCNVSVDDVLRWPTHKYYEIDLFKGIVVVTAKLPFVQKKMYLDEFAATIENWAVCDTNTVKVPPAEREQYFAYFREMCNSSAPFVCRYGIVNLISNFLDDEHIDDIFDVFQCISTWGHYYVDMAVAWLLATAMTHCRDKTVAYMLGTGRKLLPVFVYNKALQKMRDSYRVSDSDKNWTRTIRR